MENDVKLSSEIAVQYSYLNLRQPSLYCLGSVIQRDESETYTSFLKQNAAGVSGHGV